MTNTRIELSFNRIARVSDAGDFAELLIPSNRNQQHCFLAIWFSIKWADHGLVPNLQDVAAKHRVSRRTLERVRAKLRRLGLLDHVCRFNKQFGYREGLTLSARFSRSLAQFAQVSSKLLVREGSSAEKDEFMVRMWEARAAAPNESTSR